MSEDGSTTLQGTPNPEAPNPQLPIVQKVRIRYAKRGRLRFTSHRDFGRAFERAVRRAGLPIGYSSGFTPHPKISYAGASPTGAASEAEYLEIGLTRPVPVEVVRERLDEALPDGLDVMDVVVAAPGALADRLEASRWSIRLPGLSAEDVNPAVEALLSREELLVERLMKKGPRTFDIRASIVSLATEADPGDASCAILDLVVRHGTPSVRPDDVLVGLRSECGLGTGLTPVATRLAQGPLDATTGSVGDPLAHDRDAS